MSKFHESLLSFSDWFERQKRVLPWREEPSLYRVWVSEIMLQQTQVVTVVPFFERFLARFPDVESLAQASEDEVMAQWAGLGYYSRARNLQRGAKQIVESGGFPKTREGWLEIPGVGPYTAGAVVSIALNLPEPILDGNVERVLSRVERVSEKAKLWELSDHFVKTAHSLKIRPSVLNQAMMELGAMVCTPRSPKCGACPISKICKARARGDVERFPEKKKRKEWVKITEQTLCLLDRSGRVLLEKRAKGQWRAGLWDLPTEWPHDLLMKKKEIGQAKTRHIVTRHKIERETRVFLSLASTRMELREPAPGLEVERRWEPLASLLGNDGKRPGIAVGSALKRTLAQVLSQFPEVVPEH